MTSAQLWQSYCDRNPSFLGAPESTITLRLRGLQKLAEQSFEQGFKAGQEEAEKRARLGSIFDDFLKPKP